MTPVNVNRYARMLNLGLDQTKQLLMTVVMVASKALHNRENLVRLTDNGFLIYGIPYDQYRILWECDREAIIDDANQRRLVKRMHLELEGWNLGPNSMYEDHLAFLRSMNAQDMVRSGLWTRIPTKQDLLVEEFDLADI